MNNIQKNDNRYLSAGIEGILFSYIYFPILSDFFFKLRESLTLIITEEKNHKGIFMFQKITIAALPQEMPFIPISEELDVILTQKEYPSSYKYWS